MVFRRLLLLTWVCLVFSSMKIRAGTDAYCVVLSHRSPSWLENRAASEWAKYAGLMTGSKVEIIQKFDLPSIHNHFVLLDVNGNNWHALKLDGPARRLPIHRDAFLIKSLAKNGKKFLIISGKTPRAVLYGVYHYFEKVCHVGFFSDGDYIPQLKKLPMEGLDIVEKPIFDRREASNFSTWGGLKPGNMNGNARYDWAMKKKLTKTGMVGMQ